MMPCRTAMAHIFLTGLNAGGHAITKRACRVQGGAGVNALFFSVNTHIHKGKLP
jgi:hypothetical protein